MLNQEEIKRYARHIRMKDVGMVGQEKLKKASVLVIGAGGLGCPVLSYLTAAGIGKIGIVDDDVVDESNLQRQTLYDVNDIGRLKTEVAIEKLSAQNPYVNFVAHTERLTTKNALSILVNYTIVIDGSDNFPTRYLVNDACVILKNALVFGSIYTFEGQLTVFNYAGGPTYRCLYPDPPSKDEAPNCSEVGVIGVLPGVIGTRMAAECIKIVLGLGTVMSGQLLVMNVLSNQDLKLSIKKNEENLKRTVLEESYEDYCAQESLDLPAEVTAIELKKRLESGEDIVLIDVRESFEFKICRIKNSTHIPLGEIPLKKDLISKTLATVMICHHGMRSAQAIAFLQSQGYENLINLKGGIHAWAMEVDNTMEVY